MDSLTLALTHQTPALLRKCYDFAKPGLKLTLQTKGEEIIRQATDSPNHIVYLQKCKPHPLPHPVHFPLTHFPSKSKRLLTLPWGWDKPSLNVLYTKRSGHSWVSHEEEEVCKTLVCCSWLLALFRVSISSFKSVPFKWFHLLLEDFLISPDFIQDLNKVFFKSPLSTSSPRGN